MAKNYVVEQGTSATTATTVTTDDGHEIVEVHIVWYTDNTFAAEATPGAGTVPVTMTRQDDMVLDMGTLDATTPATFVSGVGSAKSVTVSPAGVTVATAYKVHVTTKDAY